MGRIGESTFCTGITCLVILLLKVNADKFDAIKFPKDQRMDIRFPPPIDLPNSPELPIGHLRPLGLYLTTKLFSNQRPQDS